MQNSGTLRVLSLNGIKLDLISVECIFTHCTELIELSINSCQWDKESLNSLCKNLTRKIEKLDLWDQFNFKDEHLEKLLTRCNKLTEFGFMGTRIQHFEPIIEKLSATLVKVELDEMSFSQLLRLASMPNLKVLCSVYGIITKENQRRIKKAMPHLEIFNGTLRVASPYTYQLED